MQIWNQDPGICCANGATSAMVRSGGWNQRVIPLSDTRLDYLATGPYCAVDNALLSGQGIGTQLGDA